MARDVASAIAARRIAAQGLGASWPATEQPAGVGPTASLAAEHVRAAASRVVGVQAQDLPAAGLALRSRVPGLVVGDVGGSGLVRTWTVRGTLHLVPREDVAWLHALLGPGQRRRTATLLAERAGQSAGPARRADVLELLAQQPLTRTELHDALEARGHAPLSQPARYALLPWLAAQGLVLGRGDGRVVAVDPPPAVDEDEALRTLATRYLAGYGPAGAEDLATWSGLALGTARRALAVGGPWDDVDGLLAAPGSAGARVPDAPAVLLLAAFDTALLGYRARDWLVPSADARRVLPGGGMLRPVVVVDGRAAATWRLDRTRRTLTVEWWHGAPSAPHVRAALDAEVADAGRYLGTALALAETSARADP